MQVLNTRQSLTVDEQRLGTVVKAEGVENLQE